MAEGFLWLRWVTKGSAEPQLGFFMLQGERSVLHPTEGFGWRCRNCSHLFHPGQPARVLSELKEKGERMRMLGTERGGAGRRGEEEGQEGRGGTDSLSEGEGWKEGIRGEARARELPLSLESGFSDGNGGVSSSPWTMAPFAPLPAGTKEREDAFGEPRSAPPARRGCRRCPGAAGPLARGPRGTKTALEEC